MAKYIPRIVDDLIAKRLTSSGALVLEGPRACGKTATGRRHCRSSIQVDALSTTEASLAAFPESLIQGAVPRLIDEWQALPHLWNVIRHAVDDRQAPGQFILTGSAQPSDDKTRHSGAGRFSRIRMRPLTLFESGVSTGLVSLESLLHGRPIAPGTSSLTLDTILEEVLRGGWPATRGSSLATAMQYVSDYVEETRRADVAGYEVGSRGRDPEKIGRVLESIARNVATPVKLSTIHRDVDGEHGVLSRHTVSDYVEILRRIMVVEEVFVWRPHLRTKAKLRSTPKLYFTDPSLAPALLNTDAFGLTADMELVGLLFENLVMRDLLVYAQACDAKVAYYHDDLGLEVDAIITGPAGRWIAVEIKLGSTMVEQAEANLLKFASKVDTDRMGEPAALVVVTGRGYSGTLPSGVSIVPIDLLRP